MLVQCPKCGSENAWYSSDEHDVWLRCLCGLMRLVSTNLGVLRIEHVDTERERTLPRRSSKLYECLVILMGLQFGTTGEITEYLNFDKKGKDLQSSSDVASQLTVLRYKGLVTVGIDRKGRSGGSTWEPTEAAKLLFKGVH